MKKPPDQRFRFGLKAKIVVLFTTISLVLVVLSSIYSYRNERAALIGGMRDKLVAAAYAAEAVLPDDYHQRIEDASSIPPEEYANYRDILSAYAARLGLKYVYTYMKFGGDLITTMSSFPSEDVEAALKAGEFLTHGSPAQMPPQVWNEAAVFLNDQLSSENVPDSDDEKWAELEKLRASIEFFYLYEDPSQVLIDVFDSEIGMPVYDLYDDPEYGPLHSAFIPLKTGGGKVYVIGADIQAPLVEAQLRTTLVNVIIGAVGFILLFSIATYVALRSLSKPIDSLLGTARAISENADYGLRAEKISNDELGELVDGFNEMLDEIEKRRVELRQHRDNLELEVEKRTAELSDLNRDLNIAKLQAEDANEAKSSFLANMTHELRTPLNAVIGYSEMLEEEAEDLGQEAFIPDLKRIKGAGKHLLGLISNILDLSKIEAGKMTIFPEWINVEEMIADVSATIQPLVDKSRNQLIVEGAGDPGKMFTDQTKLRQVLFNLLSNSAKFTEEGTVSLKVIRSKDADGDDVISMIVSDTGIGMSKEQVDKLFTPFIQADASISRKYGGTGLGLAITREFCHMLGGEVRIESEPGKGSTFTIELPAIYEKEKTVSIEHSDEEAAL